MSSIDRLLGGRSARPGGHGARGDLTGHTSRGCIVLVSASNIEDLG